MATYENLYFDLRIEFPASWKLVSWKHTKTNRNWRPLYQMRDDDLPRKGGRAGQTSKFLCTAVLSAAESAAMVDADIEISVFRLSPDEDFRMSLLENFSRDNPHYESNGIVRTVLSEGVLTIRGVDLGYVDVESNSQNRKSSYRFFFRRIDEVFWLYGKIAGHKEGVFDVAKNIVGEMDWRGARIADQSFPKPAMKTNSDSTQ